MIFMTNVSLLCETVGEAFFYLNQRKSVKNYIWRQGQTV